MRRILILFYLFVMKAIQGRSKEKKKRAQKRVPNILYKYFLYNNFKDPFLPKSFRIVFRIKFHESKIRRCKRGRTW